MVVNVRNATAYCLLKSLVAWLSMLINATADRLKDTSLQYNEF